MPALADRVAIVTGAAHGIGRAICVELAREGARVWAADVRASELASTRSAVDAVAAGSCQTAVVDVRDATAVTAFVASALDAAGRVDVLVNTAGGVAGQTMRPVEDVSDADWREIFAINLDGAFHFTRAVVPAMKRRLQRRHREHLVGRRPLVQPHRHPGLRERQGRTDRLHAPDRARARPVRHPRELDRPRLRTVQSGLRGASGRRWARRGSAASSSRSRCAGSAGRRTSRAPCVSSPPTTPRWITGQTISVDGGHWMLG